MDGNTRKSPALTEVQFQEPQSAALAWLGGCSQASENAPAVVFAGGIPAPEFHLNAIAAACRCVAAGGNLPQIDAPHPADAAVAAPPVALARFGVA